MEQITEQLQQERQERLKRSGQSEATSELPSAPLSVTDDASLQSSSYIHASRVTEVGSDGDLLRPKRSKAQLWQDMKINSISRALTLLYIVPLLTLLTRVQLNLLGRRTYLSSVVALATPPSAMEESRISLENKDDDNYDNFYGTDFETNRKYLTFSWWLLHRGSKQIMDRVLAVVKEVFGQINIREDVSLERLSDLIAQVRGKIEGSTEGKQNQTRWLQYLLPQSQYEAFVIRQASVSDSAGSPPPARQTEFGDDDASLVSPSLRRLLDETADLIESPSFRHVLTQCLDACFSNLVDYRIASEAFKSTGPQAPGLSPSSSRITELIDSKCKLAHILPVFCRQAHVAVAGSGELEALAGVAAQQGGLGNEYLTAIDQVQDLTAFAAVIYSSNFDSENAECKQAERTSHQSAGSVSGSHPNSVDSMPAAHDDPREGTPDGALAESTVVVPREKSDEAAPSAKQDDFEAAWNKARTSESCQPPET